MDLQLMEYKLMLIGMVIFVVFLVGYLYDNMLDNEVELKEEKETKRMIIPTIRS